jgi:hypothetical protein
MAWVCRHSVAGIVNWNPTGGMVVCLLCVECSLCDGPILRPEESHQVSVCVCVIECDQVQQ